MKFTKDGKGQRQEEQKEILTDVIPWAFIKGCGLDLLKKRVRSAMAIQQEPYFGSVTVYHNSHLKEAENNLNIGSTQLKSTFQYRV